MSILTTILAHKEAQDCVDRHLPHWKAQTDKLIIFTPEDSRIDTTERQISFGHACHHGAHAIERLYWLLTWLEGTDFNEFIIHEYDSISLARPSVFNDTVSDAYPSLQGIWFDTEYNYQWIGSSFVHPPLAMRRLGLESCVAQLGGLPFHCNRGMWDRVLGLAMSFVRCEFSPPGYSHNTIAEEHYSSLAEAIKNGARHFHGVKSKETLDFILERIK